MNFSFPPLQLALDFQNYIVYKERQKVQKRREMECSKKKERMNFSYSIGKGMKKTGTDED